MLDKKAQIEQLIYTSCPRGIFSEADGQQIWSVSNGLLNKNGIDKILRSLGACANGDTGLNPYGEWDIPAKTETLRKLKKDAKPLSFFRREYTDKDYETQMVTHPAQKYFNILLEESGPGPTRRQKPGEDFWDRPYEAPYRIAVTGGTGEKTVVTMTTYIGRDYMENGRFGNDFSHSFVFPEGTRPEDIDVTILPFSKRLPQEYRETKEQRPRKEKPPVLESYTMEELEEVYDIIQTEILDRDTQTSKPQTKPEPTKPFAADEKEKPKEDWQSLGKQGGRAYGDLLLLGAPEDLAISIGKNVDKEMSLGNMVSRLTEVGLKQLIELRNKNVPLNVALQTAINKQAALQTEKNHKGPAGNKDDKTS